MSKIFDFNKFVTEAMTSSKSFINKIDYTLLTPSATQADILELCEKADKLGVKSVCILPKMVKIAAEALEDSDVLICTVISFPLGTDSTSKKLAETKRVIFDGADEIDVVLDYQFLKEISIPDEDEDSEDFDHTILILEDDIEELAEECHGHNNKNGKPIILKVIVESSLLSEKETETATYICLNAGSDFIKTSTGYAPNGIGAELNKVQIMRNIITKEGSNMKIKASGGIKTANDLETFSHYVDRFGVGFAAVDKIYSGVETGNTSY